MSLEAFANSYSTTFPATENPISQSGNWTNGKANGTSWNNCATTGGTPGLAHGTSVNELTGNFDDNICALTGTWGASQTATATVSVGSLGSSTQAEVELHLNTTITSGNINGYEFDASVLSSNVYLDIVRWNGALNSFCYFHPGTSTCNSTPVNTNILVHNGDVITATSNGGVLTMAVNGVVQITVTDTSPFTGGSPGMGFWNVGGTTGTLANYGFTSFTATDSVNNYYVSSSGSDSNNGLTPTTTWATIAHADSALTLGAGGTNVYVTGNFTYTSTVITGSSGTPANRITWNGQGATNMTWTTGSDAGTCWQIGSTTSTGSYVTVQGFNITGSCATGVAIRGDVDNALNNSIHNLDGGGGSPSSSCPATGAIQQVATYDLNPGLGLSIGDIGGTISGNTINQIGTAPNPSCAEWHGIYLKFPHSTVENNVISNATSGWGLQFGGFSCYDAVSNNTLFYNEQGNLIIYGETWTNDTPAASQCPSPVQFNHVAMSNNISLDVQNSNGAERGPGVTIYGGTVCSAGVGSDVVLQNFLSYGNAGGNFKDNCSPATGLTLTNIFTDPSETATFTSWAANGSGNYSLKTGSSAIGNGTTTCPSSLPGCYPTTSITGFTRPIPPSIGAYEAGGSPPWVGVIAAPRAIDWSKVGVVGGIPSATWTQSGATIAAYSGTAAAISSALAACGTDHFVLLGPGTFSLSTGIDFTTHSNCVLRGSGANQTFLVFSGTTGCLGFNAGICLSSSDLNYSLSPSNTANVTAGLTQGSTSLTLSSTTNLAVGKFGTMDQTDDTSDTGNILDCYTTVLISGVSTPCSTNGDNGGFDRTNRSQQQQVTVTAISGSVVTISPGLYMPNWTSTKTPQFWYATNPISNVGVENLSIDMTSSGETGGNGFSLELFNCLNCWVSGIRSIDPGRSHVQCQVCQHITIQNSYFFRTVSQTSSSYGVESAGASDMLVQNNIFQQITEPMSWTGNCQGCVWSYNFDIDDIYDSGGGVYTWRMASNLPHAAGISQSLVEGNQGSGWQADIIHGSHNFLTAFRNVWSGYQQNNGNNPNNNRVAIIVDSFNRGVNIVGNVLGSTTLPTAHYVTTTGDNGIYAIGGGGSATYTVPSDPTTTSMSMRWGNWDTVTNAVRWCGNSSDPGWVAICGSVSEVPSGIPNYANPVPASTALAPSYYLSSKPTWWPGAKPWPPIGPDVTGGNLSGFSGYAYTIPAADCYSTVMGGSANGTGSVLSFNPAQCYAIASGSHINGSPLLKGVVIK